MQSRRAGQILYFGGYSVEHGIHESATRGSHGDVHGGLGDCILLSVITVYTTHTAFAFEKRGVTGSNAPATPLHIEGGV